MRAVAGGPRLTSAASADGERPPACRHGLAGVVEHDRRPANQHRPARIPTDVNLSRVVAVLHDDDRARRPRFSDRTHAASLTPRAAGETETLRRLAEALQHVEQLVDVERLGNVRGGAELSRLDTVAE
jgi:hypothetical protein